MAQDECQEEPERGDDADDGATILVLRLTAKKIASNRMTTKITTTIVTINAVLTNISFPGSLRPSVPPNETRVT